METSCDASNSSLSGSLGLGLLVQSGQQAVQKGTTTGSGSDDGGVDSGPPAPGSRHPGYPRHLRPSIPSPLSQTADRSASGLRTQTTNPRHGECAAGIDAARDAQANNDPLKLVIRSRQHSKRMQVRSSDERPPEDAGEKIMSSSPTNNSVRSLQAGAEPGPDICSDPSHDPGDAEEQEQAHGRAS